MKVNVINDWCGNITIKKKRRYLIRVITKLPNSEQSYKGKDKTHNYINRQNQSTIEKTGNGDKIVSK
jgi:hypothetical protein